MSSLESIKNHWPLLLALVACSTAWGQQQQKIASLEQTIARQSEIQKKIEEIQERGAVRDEKLAAIKEDIAEQKILLRALVESNTKARNLVNR